MFLMEIFLHKRDFFSIGKLHFLPIDLILILVQICEFIYCKLVNLHPIYTVFSIGKLTSFDMQTHEFTDRFPIINGSETRKAGHCTLG